MIIEYTKKRSVNDQAYRDLTPFLNPLPTQPQQQKEILHPPIHCKYDNKHKKRKTRPTRQHIRQQLAFNTPIKTQPKPQKKIHSQPPAPAQIQSPMRQQSQMPSQTQTPSISANTLCKFLAGGVFLVFLIMALNAAVMYEIMKDNQETTTKLILTLQQSMQINSSLQQQTLNLFAEQQKEIKEIIKQQQKRMDLHESTSKNERNDINESIELLFVKFSARRQFFKAIYDRDYHLVKLLLTDSRRKYVHANLICPEDRWTALHACLYKYNQYPPEDTLRIVRLLLDHSSDVNQPCPDGAVAIYVLDKKPLPNGQQNGPDNPNREKKTVSFQNKMVLDVAIDFLQAYKWAGCRPSVLANWKPLIELLDEASMNQKNQQQKESIEIHTTNTTCTNT